MIAIFIIFITLISCSNENSGTEGINREKKIDIKKPMSWGHQQIVYVFADDNVWKYAETYLRNTLERYYFTTENELYFDIKRAPLNRMEQFYKFNNLIFLADMQSNEPVSTYIKSIMGDSVEADITADGVGMYPQENVWARDQFVLFLLGRDERSLLELNIEMANETFRLFKQKLEERIAYQVFRQKIHDKSLFAEFPWELELPRNYQTYKEDKINQFISFLARLRNKPDRYIAVYWESMTENRIDDNWLKEKRAELFWKYYDEDEFQKRDIRIQSYNLGSQEGWKLSGRWQNKKYAVGGTFQSFAFWDAASKTAYLIDNSIYFPEGYKLAALIETEVISKTIRIKKPPEKEN